MEISKAATGLLVTLCLTAGAGGTYLIVRGDGAVPPSQPVEAAPLAPATVEQSEAVVPEAPEPVAVTPAAPVPVSRPLAAPVRVRRPAAPPRPLPQLEVAAPQPAAPRVDTLATVPAPSLPDAQVSRPIEPPAPVIEELVVAAQSVIGLQMESSVTSERARIEDEVVARVTRDVRVGDRVVIPAGARAQGEVTLVERGGRMRDRARLGVRFTSIVLADGTRLPIETETVFREGDAPGRESAAKIGGGAIGGAIIGGILGGAKGAAIGSAVGAGGGTAAVMAGGRNHATLSSGSPLTVRLEEPVTITVER
jgi:hypothetical protein